jgi:hypothetical protein
MSDLLVYIDGLEAKKDILLHKSADLQKIEEFQNAFLDAYEIVIPSDFIVFLKQVDGLVYKELVLLGTRSLFDLNRFLKVYPFYERYFVFGHNNMTSIYAYDLMDKQYTQVDYFEPTVRHSQQSKFLDFLKNSLDEFADESTE